MNHICILLATYRAEAYLSAQWNSYLGQNWKNWSVLARDDQSPDNTLELLQSLQKKYPDQLRIVTGPPENLGAIGNFSLLLDQVDAEYIALSDCDDCWLPNRLEAAMQLLQKKESETGKDTPILIHADLKVVDKNLQPIADSYWRMQKRDPKRTQSLASQLVYNSAVGCTMLFNKALLNACRPIPVNEIPMHDWWLCLVACAIGHVGYVREPTVLYRQHGQNVTQTRGAGIRGICTNLMKLLRHSENNASQIIRQSQIQAARLLQRHGDRMKPDHRDLVRIWSDIRARNKLSRMRAVLKHGMLPGGLVHNAGLLALV